MGKPPFIHRVKLRNYKSIARCDVELGPLAILVGPNGSGKSNFLDALALTRQALYHTLDHALRERGGMREVLRRSGEPADRLAVALDFALPGGAGQGHYDFELTTGKGGGVAVSKESCEVRYSGADGGMFCFTAHDGEIVASNLEYPLPRVFPDRLALVSISSLEEFRPVYDALVAMRFYRFDLDGLRKPMPQQSGPLLLDSPGGHNLPAVLGNLERDDPKQFQRLQHHMRLIVPGLEWVGRLEIPSVALETVQFTQQIVDWDNPRIFTAVNMSDGALQALAVLTALLQGGADAPSLIGLSEPERALHPAIAGVLWYMLDDGAYRSQVLATTHSAELLDPKEVPAAAILATHSEAGKTQIGPIVASSRKILQNRMTSAGELLRQSSLTPSENALYMPCVSDIL